MATELAKAYVQIIPSADGIQGKLQSALTPGLSSAGESAGQTMGNSMVGKLKAVVTAAGIGKFLKASMLEGADLEQSIGGIETLFKDSYGKVEKYANQAYKTAGLSANAYMEQVTSFSASLLQSLDGDTSKAADSANQALVDMSDNANKMGTDMQLIQNAYQGFAKQNYTMLDNLKLGYGGTKTEMERLLADAQKLTGVKYDISNLSDVYEAIHVVQEDLGITGATAAEAATTFSGSFSTMKAAADNFLATIALGENATMSLNQAMSNMLSSAVTFLLDNALPMLMNIMASIPDAIFSALESLSGKSLGGYIEKMFSYLATLITEKLPQMVSHGINAVVSFISGLIGSIPSLLNAAAELIANLHSGMIENLPLILETAAKAILTFVQGVLDNLPEIVAGALNIVATIISTLIGNFPKFLKTGAKLLLQLAVGIVQAVPELLAKIPGIIKGIIGKFSEAVDKMKDVGVNLVKGLWSGIKSVKDWVLDKIKGFGKSILDGIKGFFGIKSPSRLMRDEVGLFLAKGVGVGFTSGMSAVQKEMEKSLPTSFDVTPTINGNYAAQTHFMPNEKLIADDTQKSSAIDILKNAKITHITELNGRVIAEETYPIIDKLMSQKLVYAERGI